MSAYEKILEHAGDTVVRRGELNSMLRCPAHEDHEASLSLSVGKQDNAVVKCFAGCRTEQDVMAVWGLPMPALFDDYWHNGNGSEIEATYDYVDESGGLLYQVVRKAGKRFVQRRPDGAGGWVYKLGDTRRALYRLPAVIEAARAGATVFVVEGEKDVHALEAVGAVATCNPAGAGKWRAEYSEALRGARVIVIADRDKPGMAHAETVAASLDGIAETVAIVEAAEGKDAADHLAAGHGLDDFADAQVRQVRQGGGAPSIDAVEPNLGGAPPRHPLGGGPLGAPPSKLRVLDVDRMLTTEPPPVPWTVEPLLAEGCVTMLAGREGQGKSMLALALASAIGHGATVAGLACRLGQVLYVDAENGEREAHRRVRGLGVKRGALTYVEANGFSLAHDVELLADLVDEHRPAVLVLDSLRSLCPGLDENDSRPVEAALRPVSRLAQDKGIPVLLLHHAGKHGTEYRGSTAIGAAVEIGFTLSRREEDPEKRTRRRLACWKSRPAPEPEERWITLEARDGLIFVGEAVPFEGRPRDALREQVLGVLTGIARSARGVAKAIGREPNDGTVRRVLEDLEGEGLVERREDGWARAIGGLAR